MLVRPWSRAGHTGGPPWPAAGAGSRAEGARSPASAGHTAPGLPNLTSSDKQPENRWSGIFDLALGTHPRSRHDFAHQRDRCRPQARHFVILRYLALRRGFGSAEPPRKIMVSQISLFCALQLMIDKITRRAERRHCAPSQWARRTRSVTSRGCRSASNWRGLCSAYAGSGRSFTTFFMTSVEVIRWTPGSADSFSSCRRWYAARSVVTMRSR